MGKSPVWNTEGLTWSGARGSQLILTPESFGVVQGQWDPGWRRITALAKPENLTNSSLSCDENILLSLTQEMYTEHKRCGTLPPITAASLEPHPPCLDVLL